MVLVKNKNTFTNCSKHNSFSTGIDRLQYVKACIKDFVAEVNKPNSSSTPAIASTNCKMKTKLNKKFFFTLQDRENCNEYFCMMCSEHITSPNWLFNHHFEPTQPAKLTRSQIQYCT